MKINANVNKLNKGNKKNDKKGGYTKGGKQLI